MKPKILAGGLLALMLTSAPLYAIEASSVPPQKQTTQNLYFSAAEAADWMKQHGDKTLFIDVRTRAEVEFLGMPTLADANVPYMTQSEWHSWDEKKKNFKLEPNSGFAAEIERRLTAKGLTKNDRVIVMCRSGDRSAAAANLLAKLGYTQVYSVYEGYEGDVAGDGPHKGQRAVNGWKNAGLPWSYELDKTKMYQVGE